jgi:hypothetical protein
MSKKDDFEKLKNKSTKSNLDKVKDVFVRQG